MAPEVAGLRNDSDDDPRALRHDLRLCRHHHKRELAGHDADPDGFRTPGIARHQFALGVSKRCWRMWIRNWRGTPRPSPKKCCTIHSSRTLPCLASSLAWSDVGIGRRFTKNRFLRPHFVRRRRASIMITSFHAGGAHRDQDGAPSFLRSSAWPSFCDVRPVRQQPPVASVSNGKPFLKDWDLLARINSNDPIHFVLGGQSRQHGRRTKGNRMKAA